MLFIDRISRLKRSLYVQQAQEGAPPGAGGAGRALSAPARPATSAPAAAHASSSARRSSRCRARAAARGPARGRRRGLASPIGPAAAGGARRPRPWRERALARRACRCCGPSASGTPPSIEALRGARARSRRGRRLRAVPAEARARAAAARLPGERACEPAAALPRRGADRARDPRRRARDRHLGDARRARDGRRARGPGARASRSARRRPPASSSARLARAGRRGARGGARTRIAERQRALAPAGRRARDARAEARREEAALDFAEPAAALARRVRALAPRPGAFALLGGEPLRILGARVAEPGPATDPPGTRAAVRRTRCASPRATAGWCRRGSSAPAGGALDAADFLRGHPIADGCAPRARAAGDRDRSDRVDGTHRRGAAAPRAAPAAPRAAPARRPDPRAAARAARARARRARAAPSPTSLLHAALAQQPPRRARPRASPPSSSAARCAGAAGSTSCSRSVLDRAARAPRAPRRDRCCGSAPTRSCSSRSRAGAGGGRPSRCAARARRGRARGRAGERRAAAARARARRRSRCRRSRTIPLGHLVHALSFPQWLARALARARSVPRRRRRSPPRSNAAPPLTRAREPPRTIRDALLAELRERFPGARACRFAPRRHSCSAAAAIPPPIPPSADGPLHGPGRGVAARGRAARSAAGRARARRLRGAGRARRRAIAERVGAAGRGGRARPQRAPPRAGRAARPRASASRTCVRSRRRREPRAGPAGLAAPASTASWSTRRAPDSARCAGIPTRAGACSPTRLGARSLGPARDPAPPAAPRLRPGGTLVYSTCTLLSRGERGRGERVPRDCAGVAGSHRATPRPRRCATARSDDDGFLRTLPHRHDTDGFFAARLERRCVSRARAHRAVDPVGGLRPPRRRGRGGRAGRRRLDPRRRDGRPLRAEHHDRPGRGRGGASARPGCRSTST